MNGDSPVSMGAIFIFIREREFGSSSSHILSSEPRATKARETSTGLFFGSTSAAVGRGEGEGGTRGAEKNLFLPHSELYPGLSGGVGSLPNISRAEIRPQASQKSRQKRGDSPSSLFLPMPSFFYPETFEFSDSRANESSSCARRRRRG